VSRSRSVNDTMITEYGAVDGMKIDGENRSTRTKPTLVSLCPPKIPHELIWDRSRPVSLGSWRLSELWYVLLSYYFRSRIYLYRMIHTSQQHNFICLRIHCNSRFHTSYVRNTKRNSHYPHGEGLLFCCNIILVFSLYIIALTFLRIRAEDGSSGSYTRVAITLSYFAETSSMNRITTYAVLSCCQK
jgi:hypothetical protein